MWEKIKTWFKDSEVIFWARLQAFAGALIVALSMPEVLTLVSGGDVAWPQLIVAGALVANGFMTEYLRRRRAEDL
jgi:hypothetical protein